MKRRFLFFSLFVASLSLGIFINRVSRLREVYRSICDLSEEHFYRDDDHLEDWLSKCHRHAAQFPLTGSVELFMDDVQQLMGELKVSHFSIYSPVQEGRLWRSESLDTGLRARFIEDHLVVFQVIKASAADRAGFRSGDDIVHVPGIDQLTPWGAEHRSGEYQLRRGNKTLILTVVAEPLVIDESPQLTALNVRTARLEIPSFRSEFFAQKSWREMAERLLPFQHLIVDLRDNVGGNFAAMLRALSVLQCSGHLAGILVQPRFPTRAQADLDDNTSDEYQIGELNHYRKLHLRTFKGYPCFRGRVTVLTDAYTSSVSEIFTSSLLHRPGARVWGQHTAGDVVLAVFYDLPGLGAGYSFSIPEAVFYTPDGHQLEGQGVWPQRELYYDLNQALHGVDNWVRAAF